MIRRTRPCGHLRRRWNAAVRKRIGTVGRLSRSRYAELYGRLGHRGGRIIVGAPVADIGSDASAGKVYIFTADGAGGWDRTRLYPETQNQADNFGRGVDMDGTSGVIGAPHIDSSTGEALGKIFLFE